MRSSRRRAPVAGAVGLAFLALSAAGFLAPAAQALPTPPACAVSLDTVSQTARITPVLGEIMQFSGAINVTTGVTSPRTLSIASSINPAEWGTQVSPTTENVSDGEVVRFNATVAVPPAALASIRATLTIEASFQAVPGLPSSLVECSAPATILVQQYYRIDIDTEKPRLEVTAGPIGVEAKVIVHNLGNGRDGFTLTLEEPQYLVDSKLSTNLPRHIILEADAETTLTFTINASSDALAGAYDVAVVMASDAAPQSARDSFVFTATVKETFVGTLIPNDLTSIILLIGAVVALGALLAVRARAKRKRAARELQALLRQRRQALADEQAQGGYAEGADGGYGEGPPPEAEPMAAAPAAEKVRVKVKAPPKA